MPWWGKWWHGRGRGGFWPAWTPQGQVGVWQVQPGGLTLASVPPGSRVVVKAIMAGWGATSRLAGLGIAPGVVLEVVSNDVSYPWTPVIVRINGVEVAIGRGIAARVLVEPVSQAQAAASTSGGSAPQGESQGG